MNEGFDIERELKGKRKGGHLDQWYTTKIGDREIAHGYITGDIRFFDGIDMHTSTVVAIHHDEKILETKNTYYTLGEELKTDERSIAERRAEANKQAKEYLDKNIING